MTGSSCPGRRAAGRIEWTPASYGAVFGMLTNPCYADRSSGEIHLAGRGRMIGGFAP
jgi:hypothetical protein